MDSILLNRARFGFDGLFKDDVSEQSLNAIIETRGGFGSVRSLMCDELPQQLPLYTGLTSLDLWLEDLTSRGSHAHPFVLPNLQHFNIRLSTFNKALSALELENLLQMKGSASLHLRLLIEDDETPDLYCGALFSIAGKFEQSLETLALEDLVHEDGLQPYKVVRKLLPSLSHLQRVVFDVNLIPSMMRLTISTLPPLLPYMEVDCTHESARGVLHKVAELADPSSGASLHPFVLRCYGFPGCKDSRLHEARAEAAQWAITAWKEKRGIEVPEIIAQSWLECECKYW